MVQHNQVEQHHTQRLQLITYHHCQLEQIKLVPCLPYARCSIFYFNFVLCSSPLLSISFMCFIHVHIIGVVIIIIIFRNISMVVIYKCDRDLNLELSF